MMVLLMLRKLRPWPTINGCNSYKAAILLKPRGGAVCTSSAPLHVSRWSSSSSASSGRNGTTEDSNIALVTDTKYTLPVKFNEQAKVEGAENQVIIIIRT